MKRIPQLSTPVRSAAIGTFASIDFRPEGARGG
jgi:hypothetical protein